MDRRSFFSASGAAVAAGAAMTSVAQAQTGDARQALAAASVIEEVKKRGTLRVGLSTFVPWVMRSKSGDLIGFEIDVVKQLAQYQQFAAYCRSCALSGESDPQTFEQFVETMKSKETTRDTEA